MASADTPGGRASPEGSVDVAGGGLADAAGGAVEWAEPVPAAVAGGRYRIGSLIGRGGSSAVFRGRDAMLGRPVAIKLFPAGEAGRGELRAWREVRTLAGLNHPRLVSVFDVGTDQTRTFFVLQLVDGQNLTERLAAGPLTPGQTLHLGGALARGLGYVHRRGVVHRDLKPGNVLLDRDEQAYLTDVGVARWCGATTLTDDGLIEGATAYVAPEQLYGQPVEPSADVYALGLVLLECLTGRREYPEAPMTAAPARLERPPQIPAELPDPVAAALQAMTHPRPAQRPDASELATYFTAMLASTNNDQPQPSCQPEPGRRPSARPVTRHDASNPDRPGPCTPAARTLAPSLRHPAGPRSGRGLGARRHWPWGWGW